jgi:hypothetical protein
MHNVLQLAEFRERKYRAHFTKNMLLARVTGALVSPATADTNNDPCSPYVTSPQCDGGCSTAGPNTGSDRALHRGDPARRLP